MGVSMSIQTLGYHYTKGFIDGVHNFVKVGNFMVEINSVVLPSVGPTRVSKHVFLWFSNHSGHMNHFGGLVKKKKKTHITWFQPQIY